jgi:hypothetical protein
MTDYRSWEEPESIKDAEQKKDKTLALLFNIDSQLNNKHLTDETGKRLEPQRYQAKRQQLLKQKTQLLRELKRLGSWIRNARNPSGTELSDSSLLKRAYQMFIQLQEDGVEFEPEETQFIEVLATRIGT